MVKKTKKDEKGPPKDHFDPLLVESSQAGTVVLMLDSTEEEILLKSTQAIYNFVQKCDANKKLLLDLGSIPQLLKLVQSENRGIHRNACMALGTMSKLPEVGKVLKKFDETIPAMIHLLNPDEEAVVHEYAALCLANMAKHFSGICQIRENNGLEGLVRCLHSSDQDVKNNALGVIALMLEDYQTKTAIRELHGFPPILELLRSEYPDIQLKALNALQRITEEVPNRTALRELGALAQLVDFVGTPVYSDFHVLAINILGNCFEDAETIKVIKENGVLSRLIAIVTDVPPPPPPKQDDKKSRKDKTLSRAGTKNKVIDEKSPSKSSLDDAAQIVPTLPEVKEKISLAVMRVAKNAEIRKLLQEHEVEKMLILFLSHPDAKVQIAAAQATRIMAENLLSRDCTGKWGGIPPLVKMTVDGSDDAKEAAVMALNLLTTGNDFNCQEVARSGGLVSLLFLLSSSREITLTYALGTMVNLAKEDDLRQQILQNKLIPALVKPLSSQSCDVQAKAALAVAAFILTPEHRQQFIEVTGMQSLVLLLDSSSDEVRRNSTKAITVLTEDMPTAEEICRLGGLDILRHLKTLDTMRNAFTDEAFVKLLEHNLSAKYGLIGKLCPKDLITDGFYDMGRVRHGNRFLPLLEYHLQPVNGNRPVIVVYAPLRDTQNIADILKEHTTCDTKNLEINQDQPKPEAAPDNALDSCSTCRPRVPHLQLCVDSQLVDHICTIRNILEPFEFCSIKERAILLARFVAEKMGGPIEKGKLVNFSWELLLSQLKYQLKSNIIPLGLVTKGIHYHRALLFKVLGDRVGIPSSLVRSESNHAWNELYIEEKPMDHPKYPPKLYIMDLIYEPGLLMRADSPEAAIYMKP